MERKEIFYLMMHSTHFIYGYMVSENEWMEGHIKLYCVLSVYELKHVLVWKHNY